ncbi:MAG: hypothetical protein J5701_08365 [Bacteroidales bacterium]|nr:hypothetical protein [Bacteroidales bacterium]
MLPMLLLMSVLFSCQKPFSINADYEDIPIVYAVFNISDSTHYIKVYKSFLTDGNIREEAQKLSSISYIDSIDVYVEEYSSATGQLLRAVHFDTTTAIPKDSGYFLYPAQILYQGNISLHRNNYYKVKIYNPYTDKMVEGKVDVVDTVNLLYPKRNINPPVLLSLPYSTDMYVEFTAAPHAYLYFVKVYYYYTQVMRDSSRQSKGPVEWDLGSIDGNTSAKKLKTGYVKSDMFFRNIADNIKDDTSVVKRYTDSLIIEITSMSESVYKYVLANKPSSGINQEHGSYSNLTAYKVNTNESVAVYGIAGAKSVTRFHYNDLATPGSRDSLFFGTHTKHLRFTDIH